MKNFSTKKTYKLKPEAIDEVSEDVGAFLKEIKAPKENVFATRLNVEDILLGFQDKFGEDYEFSYTRAKFLGKPYISVSVKGDYFNPLEKNDDGEFGDWSSSLIQNSDFTPTHNYSKDVNTVNIRFYKKEVNPIFKLVIAIIAAFAVSFLRYVLPAEAADYLRTSLLDSLYNTFLGLMTTIEVPLVFLSISCGIVGIGDGEVFGKIGRKLVLRFTGIIVFFTAISGVVFSLLFTNFTDRSMVSISLKSGIDLILNLIPKSLAEPITSRNTMQVVLMAIVISIVLVMLGDKAKICARIVNEGNNVITLIARLISRLMPVFVFVVILDMIWSKNLGLLVSMWKPVAAYLAVVIFLAACTLLKVSVQKKVKIKVLMKKMLQTFLIGLGTASSIAANGECAESLNKRLGVNKRFVEFGQPVGGVVFMPSTAINFLCCAVYMASYYKVNVSLSWFFIAIILCSFVAIATPPVPGGAIAAYTVIFSQLGIPTEAVAIVIALDIVFDFTATAFDGMFLQLELVQQAAVNDLLDYDVLRN